MIWRIKLSVRWACNKPDTCAVKTDSRLRHFVIQPFKTFEKWFRTDDRETDPVGWTANLAIFRIVFLYAAILPTALIRLQWIRVKMPFLPPAVWQPISLYQWVPSELLRNSSLAHALGIADVFFIVLGLFGFYTRSTLTVATIISTYVFGLPQNFGKVDHYHHDIWFMALLAAGPSGEMFSIDAVLAAIRRADRKEVSSRVSIHGALSALRYVWLLFGLLYLSAGIGKLWAAWQSHWLDVRTLRGIIRRKWFIEHLYSNHSSMGYRYDKLPPLLLQAGGLGTIVFEMTSILLVLFRPLRWIVIVAGLAFHFGNAYVLKIWFRSLMIAYVAMVDWAWLSRRLMTGLGLGPITVIYDDGCKLCRRAIAILKTLDICSSLAPVAASASSSLVECHPAITAEASARDLYVIRGNDVAAGYDAYVLIAQCIPLLWPLAPIMRMSPIAGVGQRIYRRIADSRHCRIDDGVKTSLRAAPTAKSSVYLAPHVVGILLLLGEAATVCLNAGHGLSIARMVLGPESSARDFKSWKRARWSWPFDQYPTFAYSLDVATYRTWEPRLVYADGSEASIEPDIFVRSLGDNSSVAEANVQRILKTNDPNSRKRHALTLAALLWKNIPDSEKSNLVAIRGYISYYDTDPDSPEPLSRILIDSFSIQELQAYAANDGE